MSSGVTRRRREQTRPGTDHESEEEFVWRKKQFLDLCKIQFSLEDRSKTTKFSKSESESLGFKCGAALNVDEHDAIDIEARYFVPAPVEEATESIEQYRASKRGGGEWGLRDAALDIMGGLDDRHWYSSIG